MKNYPYRFVARPTIEFSTPFIIGGEDDLFSDSSFVRDANGLPALPGTSLAGVLRHRFQALHGAKSADELFGWQGRDGGRGSRLSLSWGCIHDCFGRPVEGLVQDGARLQDPVLFAARQAIIRDHVRIGHRGCAAETGKFDERVVQAGHRFTFELHLVGNVTDQAAWEDLLAILAGPDLRLGGKTRRGFGAFEIVGGSQRLYRLDGAEDRDAYLALSPSLGACLPGGAELRAGSGSIGAVSATLHLVPEGFWLFGGGDGDQADINPVRETRIIWESPQGKVSERMVVIPGSSIKGALAHRTAFHYNALSGRFADRLEKSAIEQFCGEQNPAVKALFGYCRDNDPGVPGQRGRVLIDDLYYAELPGQPKALNHVAIDRFTGGAFEGALFSEEPLWRGAGFTLRVVVAEAGSIEDPAIKRAFALALTDLAEGRLALGAGAGRGNGFFNSPSGVNWNDSGAWSAQGGAA